MLHELHEGDTVPVPAGGTVRLVKVRLSRQGGGAFVRLATLDITGPSDQGAANSAPEPPPENSEQPPDEQPSIPFPRAA